MTKKIISEEIFYECRRASMFSSPYKWGEVKSLLEKEGVELKNDDILTVGLEEGWNEGDSARDDMFFIKVRREREETDEEFEKRKLLWQERNKESKKLRYENYLKLKKEFEGQ